MSSLQADNFQQSRKVRVAAPEVRSSRLAWVALLLGVVAWAVPLLPAVVIFMAAGVLVAVRRALKLNIKLRGGAFAAIALVLGVAGFAAQSYVGVRGYAVYQQLQAGPTSAIADGLDGDVDGFLAAFPEASAGPDAAELFLGELESRYGALIHAKPKQSPKVFAAFGEQSVTQSYRLQFTRGIVTAEAVLRPQPTDALHWPAPPSVGSLTIIDSAHGTLVFPETRLSEVQP